MSNGSSNDIKHCGFNPETVKQSRPHLTTDLMVRYAYHQIDRENPVGFFGMVFVLEGTSTALATQAAEALKTSLQLPNKAFSYLLSMVHWTKTMFNFLSN